MDLTFAEMLSAISSVGFPIVGCIALFWLYVKMLPILTDLSNNTKEMKETLDSVKDTLNLFNQNFANIFTRLSALEAVSNSESKGKHGTVED